MLHNACIKTGNVSLKKYNKNSQNGVTEQNGY
jgi:hypothetical protein